MEGDAAVVDFANHDEVKRWLNAIKPIEQQREVAVAMAARAALRVLPLLARELRRGARAEGDIQAHLILSCLRAAALSWTAGRYPVRDELRRDAYLFAAGHRATDLAADDATYSQARAAGVVVTTEPLITIDVAADAMGYAVSATDKAALTVAHTAVNATAEVLELDRARIDSGHSGAELAGLPLWPLRAAAWATDNWRTLKSALLAAGQDWEVWTDWYEARLAGDTASAPNEALEVARAMIPDAVWRKGPETANAEIRRLIEELGKESKFRLMRLVAPRTTTLPLSLF